MMTPPEMSDIEGSSHPNVAFQGSSASSFFSENEKSSRKEVQV